jgi:hypothetical protein
VEAPAPTGKRGARDKKAGAAAAPARGGPPTKGEIRERLLAAIAELEGCRGILLGKPTETAARRAPVKARRSARA